MAELQEPQVVAEMAKLKASVSARRRYESKVKTDPVPVLLEAHRKRARESWRRKQQAVEAVEAVVGSDAKMLSFTLTL